MKKSLVCFAVLTASLMTNTSAYAAREASFLNPMASTTTAKSVDAITVEPKGDIDIGESNVDIARRIVLFFVNQTNMPVSVSDVTINGDGSLNNSIVSDDCSKEKSIAANSRCSMVVSITPVNAGPWSAEVLMTHNGPGRITRSKISGKAKGGLMTSAEKDASLSLSTKEIKPVDFGKIELGGSQVVRSALMVNDSTDPITLMSIDVIAADNGLARLEQGCALDMDLKPGESCPITLVWKPITEGAVSTDLIVRHSGKMGFVVIPVRGEAKMSANAAKAVADQKAADTKSTSQSTQVPSTSSKFTAPPTAAELEKAVAGSISPVSTSEMGMSSGDESAMSGSFHLIGTVGNRAVLLKPNGSTAIIAVDDEVDYGGLSPLKLLSVTSRSAEVLVDGKKKTLKLKAAGALTSKASQKKRDVSFGSDSESKESSPGQSKKGSQ